MTDRSLPPLKLPLFYLGFATICFALALTGIVSYPQDLTGFYYHPHILALTHLVTLGWISGNILGLLYIIGPMALQIHLPVKVYDVIAFVTYCIGVTGMVAHFWQDLPFGMAWSATCAYLAIVLVGIKVIRAIVRSKAPGFVRLHIILAFSNLFLGGAWGVLVAFHKVQGFLPTSSSPNVIAHAHLAAVGWATMMVFGIAYRLLPMFLPAEPSKGIFPWASPLLIELGVLGFFFSILSGSKTVLVFAGMIASGMFMFFLLAIRTTLRRKPAPPPDRPRPDFSLLHAPFAFLSLFSCIVLGFALLNVQPTERSLQWALAYGILGLIGFLGQIVTGLKPKILSVFTWYHAFSRKQTGIPRPVDMPIRPFQIVIFALWITGLPLLTAGVVRQLSFPIRAGGTFLLAALILATLHEYSILKRIWRP